MLSLIKNSCTSKQSYLIDLDKPWLSIFSPVSPWENGKHQESKSQDKTAESGNGAPKATSV